MAANPDPLAFLLNIPRPSASQEELLARTPFVGDTSSPFNADVPSSSAPIFMQSLPHTQIPSQDVFLTPLEEPLVPSSEEHRGEVLPLCTVNMADDFDFVTMGGSDCSEFMDLGNDSDLGYLNQIGSDFAPEKSRVLGEPPEKRMKLGFDSLGVQSMNVDNVVVVGGDERMNVDSVEKDGFCSDTEMGENLNAGENLNDEVMEKKIRMLKMLASVMQEEPKKDEENYDFDDSFVFEALRFLAERERKLSKNTDEDEYDDLWLLKACKDDGLTFTRPSWLKPDDWNSGNSELLNCINFVD